MCEMALEARGVSKRYGDHDALSSVDLRIAFGELHGLLGPNGAGKTTLMRVLLGLVRRDAGRVHALGRELTSTGGPLPDGVAGFVETPAFYPYLTGRQNLALLVRLDGGDTRDRQRVARVLEQVGLTARADAAVRGYSAGMRQRLGIAAALLRSPRLLFLDEPTSSLDPAGARDIRTLARAIADSGAAVVLSSHDMSEVEELCTTLTVINHGRVVFAGETDDLRKRASSTMHLLTTSDDTAALVVARERGDVRVVPAADGMLEVIGAPMVLDAYVIALGGAGIAVRSLEHRARSLESLFLELTSGVEAESPTAKTIHADGNLNAVPVTL